MDHLLLKYPNRVPVVIRKCVNCNNIPELDKTKYLVPSDYTLGQLVYIIRKRMCLKPSMSIFVFIDNVLPSTSDNMLQLFNTFKSSDNLLYITYSGENTFGSVCIM